MSEFLASDPAALIGQISARLAASHRAAENDQIRAWTREIDLLRAAFAFLGDPAREWSVLFEAPIIRLGQRMDVVVLTPAVVTVIEFKVNATAFRSADVAQTEDYALSLRDFHEASQSRVIVPILCADEAPRSLLDPEPIIDGVAQVMKVNGSALASALERAARLGPAGAPRLSAVEFEYSPYRPTPTIIEAARKLYAGHTIAELGRSDAAAEDLSRSADRLTELALQARADRAHFICFVTGTPGAGKTLLGLNLALRSQAAGGNLPPASLLSGNPPLVHVLVEALAHDAHENRGLKKPEARREASSAVQGLLRFLREHGEGAAPPEHVIVFDEAQRAWDAEIGLKLLNRRRSEPAEFLRIMAQLDWACLVCLVGPGQEINRGEGGLALWGEALEEARAAGQPWRVFAAPQALFGGADVGPSGIFTRGSLLAPEATPDPALHLANAMRTFRNPQQIRWVSALLGGELDAAARLARSMDAPPALVSRDLPAAKAWLRQHQRGGRSAGLLTSSGAVRLIAEGIPPAPRSNELDAIAHWFLRPPADYRSAGALETPLSEFGCQGLELDFVGVAWGTDLIWRHGWVARGMAAPRWRELSDVRRQHRLNGYRVLLTRARKGLVIYVPRGEAHDETRSPREFDGIVDALYRAGAADLRPVGV